MAESARKFNSFSAICLIFYSGPAERGHLPIGPHPQHGKSDGKLTKSISPIGPLISYPVPGGHPVGAHKIRSRYRQAAELLRGRNGTPSSLVRAITPPS
jgi:hypothetical protein